MPSPRIDFTILSSALGNTNPSPSGIFAIFGTSSAGTAATVGDPYRRADNIITDYGYGPGPELAAQLVNSGIPTIFVKVATNTAGAASAVTFSGTGTSVLTISGSVYDQYDVVVTVVRSGTAGSDPEPGFTISLDGGETTTAEIRMPANRIYSGFAATTGLVFNFTAAAMVEDDEYTFTTTPPTWTAADVATAVSAMQADAQEIGLGYVVGACSKSQADTILAAVVTFLNRDKFPGFIVEARDISVSTGETEAQWMAAISADYATFTTDYMGVAAGGALIASSISGVNYRRNIGQLAIVRAGRRNIGRDIGAVEDGALCPSYGGTNQTGPLSGVPVSTVYHDEGGNPGLDEDRFITVTSFVGQPGYYITNPNIMCGPTSDFTLLQYRRVMNEACVVTRNFFTRLLSTDVRLNRRTGFILERDALAIESGNDTQLEAALTATNQASAVETVLSRSDNISTSKTLTVTVGVVPLGYIKIVDATMSFRNPAFNAAA
jgi:hypothetical protein